MVKVLIAEDSILLADMLEDFLESQGFEVCGIASTVTEAVMLADLHQPDIAIFDYRLANGEFGSQIRPLLKDKLKMRILYASGDPLDKKLNHDDGDAYIQKPYGLYDLIRSIGVVLDNAPVSKIDPSLLPRGFHFLGNVTKPESLVTA